MNMFNLSGASSSSLLNDLGGYTRIVSDVKFHDDLRVLLETQKGTLIGDPAFGSNLYTLLFEPANMSTAGLIRQAVSDAIQEYYPNVTVRTIDVTFTKATVKISISYLFTYTNVGNTAIYEFIRGNVSF